MAMKYNKIPKEKYTIMNKKELAEILKNKINKPEEETILILTIIEENNFNEDLIIEEIKLQLNLNTEESHKIYKITSSLIKNVIKEKIKHPFIKHIEDNL